MNVMPALWSFAAVMSLNYSLSACISIKHLLRSVLDYFLFFYSCQPGKLR